MAGASKMVAISKCLAEFATRAAAAHLMRTLHAHLYIQLPPILSCITDTLCN